MISALLRVIGLLAVAYGLFVLAPWLGIAGAGAAVYLIGWALDAADEDSPGDTG